MSDEPEKVELRGYVDRRLRDLVIAEAEERDIPLSEAVARLLAEALHRPDLGAVPRKRIGRPLGKAIKRKGETKT